MTARWPRITIGRTMIGVAALAVLLGLTIHHPVTLAFLLAAGFLVGATWLTRLSDSRARSRPPWKLRRSTWMALGLMALASAGVTFLEASRVALAAVAALIVMALSGIVEKKTPRRVIDSCRKQLGRYDTE